MASGRPRERTRQTIHPSTPECPQPLSATLPSTPPSTERHRGPATLLDSPDTLSLDDVAALDRAFGASLDTCRAVFTKAITSTPQLDHAVYPMSPGSLLPRL